MCMSYSSKKKNLAKYSHVVFNKQLKLNGESLLEEHCTGSCQLGNLVCWSYSWIRDLGRDSQSGHQWDLGILPQKWYVSLLSFLLIFRQPNLRHFYVFWKFRALLSVFLKESLGTSLFTHLWLNLGYRSPGHCTLRGFPAFTCSALLFPNVCSMNPKRVPTLTASCKAGGDPSRVCRVGVCRRWAGENARGGPAVQGYLSSKRYGRCRSELSLKQKVLSYGKIFLYYICTEFSLLWSLQIFKDLHIA